MVISERKLQVLKWLLQHCQAKGISPIEATVYTKDCHIQADVICGLTLTNIALDTVKNYPASYVNSFKVVFITCTPEYINNDEPNQVIMMPEGSYPVYGYADGMVTVYGFEG